jgi:hypothetical protein
MVATAVLGALLVRRASGAATVVGPSCRGLLVGVCEWQFQEVRDCLPETPSYSQSLTAYSKHANPDPIRRRGSDGRCGARVFGHRQLRSACRSGSHDGERVKGLFNFKGAVVISLS